MMHTGMTITVTEADSRIAALHVDSAGDSRGAEPGRRLLINIPKFLEPMFKVPEEARMPWLMYVSVAFGLGRHSLARICSTWFLRPCPKRWREAFSGPYRWIYNKYFVDEFYDSAVVESRLIDGSRELLWRVADVRIIDGAVNGVGTTASGVGSSAEAGAIRLHPQLCRMGGGRRSSW